MFYNIYLITSTVLFFHLQGEQGDDGKVEGPPGPLGDTVSHT